MEKVSVVIPTFNEKETITPLVERIIKTFQENQIKGDIIVVDGKSTDNTGQIADELAKKYGNIKVFHHRKKLGKSAALNTGFLHAEGDIIVIIDGDLQYMPEDIPKLLKLIDEGYDVVNGWRRERKDSFGRKISSNIYNTLVRKLFKLQIHDYNCGLKAFRKEVIENISLRKELHRYIIIMASMQGYKVCETEVQHLPRLHGKTKYGIMRLLPGTLDLFALKVNMAIQERPIVLFGVTGIILILIGGIADSYVVLLKAFYGTPISQHLPLLLLGILLIITGMISFFFGFLADMIANLRIELLKKAQERKENNH